MKRVDFETAKYLRDNGFPQESYISSGDTYIDMDGDTWAMPYVFEVWLWLWNVKHIRFDVQILSGGRGCQSNTEQLECICSQVCSDPESAVMSAIDYLVTNNIHI